MAVSEQRSVLILGVGNILLRDEGLGVRAVEYLRERYEIPPSVEVVDGGTAGLGLLELLRDFSNVIIIDALAADSPPGTIFRITERELKKSPPFMTTAHEIGVADLLAVAELEGITPDVVVIGMEPGELSPGLELTPLAAAKLPRIAELVKSELEGLGIELEEKADGA